VYGVTNIKEIEVHTIELLASEQNYYDAEFAVEKLK
jgi:hypothetical protein